MSALNAGRICMRRSALRARMDCVAEHCMSVSIPAHRRRDDLRGHPCFFAILYPNFGYLDTYIWDDLDCRTFPGPALGNFVC